MLLQLFLFCRHLRRGSLVDFVTARAEPFARGKRTHQGAGVVGVITDPTLTTCHEPCGVDVIDD